MSAKKVFNGRFSYKKDVGKVRMTNEDESKVLINSQGYVLMMVADGMGGCNKGDYASSEVIRTLADSFKNKRSFVSLFGAMHWLNKTLKLANKKIYDLSYVNVNYKGMGTTVVVALIYKNKLIIANAGDSRCYLLNKKEFKQLTEDQTYVNYLYRTGAIKESELKTHPDRHVITNAVGIYPTLSIETEVHNYNGETLFLCSDGLYNNIPVPDIENILRTDEDVETKVNTLINVANYNGGTDNISVALWESIDDKN